ncbi:MAG: leucine-rich repeat domain-containing protein [Verrucomicrobia bacterium]|nr:leucine-rich repeat domain-containing protein [Verrucomicrobiota bacterium]
MKKNINLYSLSALKLGLMTVIALAFLLGVNQSRAAVGDIFTDYNFKYTVLSEEGTVGTVSVAKQSTAIPSGAVVIPDAVNQGPVTYSVTDIGNSAFQNCRSLTSAVMGSGVTSIGGLAFYDCSALTDIMIPDSVTSIGNHTFHNCSSLTSITIPDSVTSIGYGAFYECTGLTDITIPDSVTSIETRTFLGCRSLMSAVIGSGVTSIGGYAFYGCTGLTYITISDSVTSIGNHTFHNCSSLTSVVIGSGVTSIGGYAFYGCSSLVSVNLPEDVNYIGYDAFNGCNNLESAYFKGDAPELGEEVFDSDPILYYSAGASGWTTPTWNGYRTATWVPEEPPVMNFEVKEGKLILTFSGGNLEASSDLILWSPVEGALGGKYEVELPATGKLFYRVAR